MTTKRFGKKEAPAIRITVLELHPAWRMTPPKGMPHTYSMQAMDKFSGYGLTKLKTILNGFGSKKWPTMYQDCQKQSMPAGKTQ